MIAIGQAAAMVVAVVTLASAAEPQSGTFRVEDVSSIAARPIDSVAASTVLFADEAKDPVTNPSAGLIPFNEWARTRPDEKQVLGLYSGYAESTVTRKIGGVTHRYPNALTMYVAEGRFILRRPLATTDLAQFATLNFVEKIDPAIKHQSITPKDVTPLNNRKFAHNVNPERPWCVGTGVVCLRSHYRLEGKLPLGIQLANKVRGPGKQIADYLEFESELAARSPDELNQAVMARLTHLDTPFVGALEQTTFYVNQILQFAKFLVVFQKHPSDPNKTVATAFFTLAIQSRLLDMKKEYARVPVLRNLVPIRVLMGRSSFNTGTSISAGLPSYARSRIQAVARILDGG
jgi:hypothetical protein